MKIMGHREHSPALYPDFIITVVVRDALVPKYRNDRVPKLRALLRYHPTICFVEY
jgi:hypothetical protein